MTTENPSITADFRLKGRSTPLKTSDKLAHDSIHTVPGDCQIWLSKDTTSTILPTTTEPRRILTDFTKLGRRISRRGSCARSLGESFRRVMRDSHDGPPTKTEPRRLLTDYTKQGRRISRLGSCASFFGESFLQVMRDNHDGRSKSMNCCTQPDMKTSFRTTDDASNLTSDDINDPENEPEDDEEPIEFVIRIPPRTSRLERSSAVELRERFQRQPRSNHQGCSFIERVLSKPKGRSRRHPVIFVSK